MDFYLFQRINQFAGISPILDKSAIFFTDYLGYILVFILLLFLLRNFKKYQALAIQVIGAAILSRLIIVNIIRWLLPRSRPFVENQINLLLSHEATSSFPSGHAALYFALATVIFLYGKKVYPVSNRRFWYGAGVLFFIASFLISIARVFVGIHWPSDVIAGAAVGIFSGWLAFRVSRRIF